MTRLSRAPSSQSLVPLCVPEIRGNEWKYIKECLDSNWVSSVGAFVDQFEHQVAQYVGTRYSVATVNGTAALHIALLVAGIEADDEVLVPTLTFIAPANAIRYVGAWPVFIDVDPLYWQMDPQKVADFLETRCRWHKDALYNMTSGRRIRAILPVHILGHPVDMDPILEMARRYNLRVIEDATESLGAKYKGKMVGNLGDIACFSFNGNKIITTGGGGMLVTNSDEWARKAKHLTTQAKDDPVEYIHSEIGYNYRLTNIQAAMGVAQIEQIDKYISAKRRIASTYGQFLQDFPGISPMLEAPWASSIFWMYTVTVEEKEYGIDSRSLMRWLEQCGVQTRPLWEPLHRSRAHAQAEAYRGEVADTVHRRALSLPCSVGLAEVDVERVVTAMRLKPA